MNLSSVTYVYVVPGLVLLLAGVRRHNRLVRARERTLEAWSGVDVQLRRRAELIPNLVETVKACAAHEREVFLEAARARARLAEASGAEAAAEANGRVSRSLARLAAVAEAHPELQASRAFLDLQAELSDVEEKIAWARQFYNRNVAGFNARIRSFPDLVVARAWGFGPFPFFDAERGDGRTPPAETAPASARPAPGDG